MRVGEGLFVCEMKTLGSAYQLIQWIEHKPTMSFEVVPTAEGAVLLVSGEVDALVSLLSKATDMASNRIITSVSPRMAEAYLGLQNPPLENNLFIFESRQVGDVFEAASRLEQFGASPFDLRILRGGSSKAYVLATGSLQEGFSVDGLSGQFSRIENPSPSLRQLFEIAAPQ